jgi:hypothetical protein
VPTAASFVCRLPPPPPHPGAMQIKGNTIAEADKPTQQRFMAPR